MLCDKATLELIQQTACKAQDAQVLDLREDGRRAWVRIGATLQAITLEPPCRRHQVHRLADLIEYAKREAVARAAVPTLGRPVAWHGEAGVVLVLDDQDRRDTVTFPLTFSRQFLTLKRLEAEPKAMRQDAFIRLLRLDLGVDKILVNLFRKLDWQNGSRTNSEIRHGADRLGREIQAEVQGIGELPEEIAVQVPVYDQPDERAEYRIDLAVEIDAANQLLQLVPLPGALLNAVACHQASIRQRLLTELQPEPDEELQDEHTPCVPVYYGEPLAAK